MEKFSKDIIKQVTGAGIDEVTECIVDLLTLVLEDFQEIKKFQSRHERIPLILSRSQRVRSVQLEKLFLSYRKKSLASHRAFTKNHAEELQQRKQLETTLVDQQERLSKLEEKLKAEQEKYQRLIQTQKEKIAREKEKSLVVKKQPTPRYTELNSPKPVTIERKYQSMASAN
jgi:septal ring factor EnvC (AmiA/AmiB activator)